MQINSSIEIALQQSQNHVITCLPNDDKYERSHVLLHVCSFATVDTGLLVCVSDCFWKHNYLAAQQKLTWHWCQTSRPPKCFVKNGMWGVTIAERKLDIIFVSFVPRMLRRRTNNKLICRLCEIYWSTFASGSLQPIKRSPVNSLSCFAHSNHLMRCVCTTSPFQKLKRHQAFPIKTVTILTVSSLIRGGNNNYNKRTVKMLTVLIGKAYSEHKTLQLATGSADAFESSKSKWHQK